MTNFAAQKYTLIHIFRHHLRPLLALYNTQIYNQIYKNAGFFPYRQQAVGYESFIRVFMWSYEYVQKQIRYQCLIKVSDPY